MSLLDEPLCDIGLAPRMPESTIEEIRVGDRVMVHYTLTGIEVQTFLSKTGDVVLDVNTEYGRVAALLKDIVPNFIVK